MTRSWINGESMRTWRLLLQKLSILVSIHIVYELLNQNLSYTKAPPSGPNLEPKGEISWTFLDTLKIEKKATISALLVILA